MLFNIGFDMATYLTTQDFWNCFIFHDVDLLPEDDRNLYTCPTKPRQMAVGMRVLRFLLLSSFSVSAKMKKKPFGRTLFGDLLFLLNFILSYLIMFLF